MIDMSNIGRVVHENGFRLGIDVPKLSHGLRKLADQLDAGECHVQSVDRKITDGADWQKVEINMVIDTGGRGKTVD